MKLIHNMVCHTIFLATAEGGRLAERLGIPLETAISVFNAGNARSFVSEQRFPNHVLSGSFDGRSTVANLAKDLGLAAKLAGEVDGKHPYSDLAADILARAMQQGMAEQDFTTLYRHLERLVSEIAPPGYNSTGQGERRSGRKP
jgi:3-hydroxyisobutyrate dehydrogenase